MLRWTRRLFLGASGVAPLAAVAAPDAKAPALPKLTGHEPDNLFTRIGVRPIINARGTYTIISGSRSLPEVKQAMFEASHYYVHMDEMMAGIGAELARLTGAEWGIATNGCEAAIVQATIACIAGADVEKAQALPYIKARDQVIVPKHSRNPYDIGIRMVGAEIVEVETPDQLHAAMGPRVAMIYVMSSPNEAKSALPIRAICVAAKEKAVPVFVDAAAEEPVRPNIHLAAGATLVGYSGGKCLRGPQSSGMIIGDKSLCQAAYFNAAPHHCYGRALKCSKEEAMGLLAAVRQWYVRDHDAEQRMWRGWLQHIEARLAKIPTIKFEYLDPSDLSNRAPRLRIRWQSNKIGIGADGVVIKLDRGTPRIMVESGTDTFDEAQLTVMPYMMDLGEERIVADALFTAITTPFTFEAPRGNLNKFFEDLSKPKKLAQIAGDWAVTVQYLRGEGRQQFAIRQDGGQLRGQHKGEIYTGRLHGDVRDNLAEIKSNMVVPGNGINWTFTGTVDGNHMSGTVDMGEYGPATFTAVRA
jgi:seryl-tRNA(Sec) selenium transferase